MQVARKNYLEWKRQSNVFAAIEAFRGMTLEETSGDHPLRVKAGFASAGIFPMLGAPARIGRVFTAAEEVPGADRVAVLSDGWFERTTLPSRTLPASSSWVQQASRRKTPLGRPRADRRGPDPTAKLARVS